MIILSNCLTSSPDEGSRKVADSLVRLLRKAEPSASVVTYGSSSEIGDVHLKLNKWLLSGKLISRLRGGSGPLLYIPTPAKMTPLSVRSLVLRLSGGAAPKIMMTMPFPVGKISSLLLRLSGAELIVVSRSAWEYYRTFLKDRVHYLKLGVDTKRFCPVDYEQKARLREKYGIPLDKKVVLHVGHLNTGRNVGVLLSVAPEYHTVLVVSTQTAAQQDRNLRARLLEKENMTLLDSYLPDIQELYQLADIYLFPVQNPESCIDAPLSALEAASCGIPVVATPYGELRELLSCEGFYSLEDMAPESVNAMLRTAVAEEKNPRESVLGYDWDIAAAKLLRIINEKSEVMTE